MKLQIASDLHLEFHPEVRINNADADILCLAGDICLAYHLYKDNPKGNDYREFFKHVSSQFDRVLYVMGNHEHYSGRWNDTADWLRNALSTWSNIQLLDKEWLDIDNTRIVGTSLWTDLNKSDPLTMMSMPSMMSDYRAITICRNGVYHKLRPIDTVTEHNLSLETIKQAADAWQGNVVVLGHHAPTRFSIHEKYKHEHIMNGAFCSNLDEFILNEPKIKLWIHGHVHNSFDYRVGDCRVVCNPYGYPGELTDYRPDYVIEI